MAGNGKYEFIADDEIMNEKIISLLNDSITPFLDDIHFEYDKELVEIIIPNPNSINFLRKNQ